MWNFSDHDSDHKLRWWGGECKHVLDPINQLTVYIYQSESDEKWQNEISPDAECWVARRSLPALRSLSARQVSEVRQIWRGWRNEINTWFLFRSLPLPKLGLNNSCWNAGRSCDGDVYVCVRNLLLNFSLVWSSDKNADKKWFHVSLSNSCLGGVNDYTSDVNISYETRKWLHFQED